MKKIFGSKLKTGIGFAAIATALGAGGYFLSKQLPQLFASLFQVTYYQQKEPQIAAKIKALTKEAAQKRASEICSYIDYKLLLNLKEGDCYSGIVKSTFTVKNQKAQIFIDYNGKAIKQLLINKEPLITKNEFSEFWDGSFINIPSNQLVPGSNSIEIWFENSYCSDVVDTDKKQYIYSNLEPYWASRIFPCMDQPNLKGKFELMVINPVSHVCIANEEPRKKEIYDGNMVVKEIGETDIDLLDFLKTVDRKANLWIFPATPIISTYLFAVISGPFKEIRCSYTYKSNLLIKPSIYHKDIQQTCYCRESLFNEMQQCADQLFIITQEAIKFYEDLFQYPYPFSKYDSIFCPEFNVSFSMVDCFIQCGAMENVGAVTFNDIYLFKGDVALEKISRRAQTITHELAHMWFGNLVTMDWWDDLWLNESFADFVALYCLREIAPKFSFKLSDFGVMSNMRKIWGYREDGKVSTHPIAAEVNDTDEADSIFDGITYSKGQAVIRQLLNLLGRDNFSKGISEYFKQYQYKNATFKNFLNSLQKYFQPQEDPTYSLDSWAEEWLRTASYNEVAPVWDANNVGENAELEIIQGCVQEKYPTLRHHKMQFACYGENGEILEEKSILVKAERSTKTSYNGSKKVKAILLNYQDDCFLKVILDSTSLCFFKKNLHKIKEILSRNLIWRALYDMVHDGKISSEELINLAVEQIPKEQETVLVTLVFMFCKLAIQMFTPIKAKPILKQKLFQMILTQIKNQSMDSPTKMAFQDELVASAVGYQELSFLEPYLTSEDKDLKLTIQQKWTVVEAFARSQEFNHAKKQEVLEAVANSDKSSEGNLNRETAEAMMSQKESDKMKLWKQIIDPKSKRSLFSLMALMKGINLEETWELSRKFHDLFFEHLIPVFQSRQLQFAQNYFAILFPKTEDFPYLLQKVEEAQSKVPSSMQTLIKLLVGIKDEINIKMRAVEAYSNFQAQN